MTIGVIGLGKLGLPFAEAAGAKGHDVLGYDTHTVKPSVYKPAMVADIVRYSDLVFVIVQTPHGPEFEGTKLLTEQRADFDYTFLVSAVKEVAQNARDQRQLTRLVVVSTCLPGTYQEQIKQHLNKYVEYLYSPSFTASGTVAKDLYNAEFNLIGAEGSTAGPRKLKEFYKTLNTSEFIVTDITTAEAIKVSYNTFITAKTVLGNLWGEIAHVMGLDFKQIHRAWSLSTKRLLSDKYLHAGMGDGGPCHPRDNIALSFLAKKLPISHDIFEDLMIAREHHEWWHADLAIEASMQHQLPLIVLGKAFKPDTTIETGSAAMLMAEIIQLKGHPFSHVEDLDVWPKAVYFIATDHTRYRDLAFPEGSVVIDPRKL